MCAFSLCLFAFSAAAGGGYDSVWGKFNTKIVKPMQPIHNWTILSTFLFIILLFHLFLSFRNQWLAGLIALASVSFLSHYTSLTLSLSLFLDVYPIPPHLLYLYLLFPLSPLMCCCRVNLFLKIPGMISLCLPVCVFASYLGRICMKITAKNIWDALLKLLLNY